MSGIMLVRVFDRLTPEGRITTWTDGWCISSAFADFLAGYESFEILGYYPNWEGAGAVRDPEDLSKAFHEAERRYAP